MILKIYTVYDNLGQSANAPFIELNDETAIRRFRSQASTVDYLKENIGDYDLYCVGTFDDVNIKVKSISTGSFVVVRGSDLFRKDDKHVTQ